eukprot:sb/3476257/
MYAFLSHSTVTNYNIEKMCQRTTYAKHFLKWQQCMKCVMRLTLTCITPGRQGKFHVFLGWFNFLEKKNRRKTLKSGCLSLLTIHRFWYSRQVRAVVRVWLGFGLGVSVSAIDSLSDAV